MTAHPRMTADAFRDSLKTLGFTANGFANYARVDSHTVRRWLHGQVPVAGWVPVMLDLLHDAAEFSYSLETVRREHDRLIKANRALFTG
jgi:hypothetical protein